VTPVPGVELIFDRVGGRLVQVVIEAGAPSGPVVVGEPALAYLGRVLGYRMAAALRQAPYATVPSVTPQPHPTMIAALSRLSRLDTARRTTPIPGSPLWAAEAADLARQAGWTDRTGRYAHNPVIASPRRMAATGPPATAGMGSPAAAPAVRTSSVSSLLDPTLVSPGVFRYGLSPDSDLDIRVHGAVPLITAEAILAPGAGCSALAECRARLIDSDARRVLAVSPLRPDGPRVRAELPFYAPVTAGALWVEVVDDGKRPVWGTRLRRMRRALRWADAALRAASRPAGLDPDRTSGQWAQLATLAWDRCRADWAAAGDASRAAAAARLARHPVQWTCPYLAEAIWDPAATW
jgi:hypothetical protein